MRNELVRLGIHCSLQYESYCGIVSQSLGVDALIEDRSIIQKVSSCDEFLHLGDPNKLFNRVINGDDVGALR